LVTASRNGVLKYWDLHTETIVRTAETKKAKVDIVQLLSEDRTAILCDRKTIFILDAKGSPLISISTPCSAFRVSYNNLVTIYSDFHRGLQDPTVGPTIVWDVSTGEKIAELVEPGEKADVGKYCVHASGHLALVGNHDGTATVWDLKGYRLLGSLSHNQISKIGSAKSVKSVLVRFSL